MPKAQLLALTLLMRLNPETNMKSLTSGMSLTAFCIRAITSSVRSSEAPSGSWMVTKNEP